MQIDTTVTDPAAVVGRYFDMWNTDDRAQRLELIASTWTADAGYVDPLLVADGHEAIDGMVQAVHGQYPGHRFRRTTGIDAHHDRIRFGWELVGPDGSLTVAGVDVGCLAADGRLASITGFFGEPAPAA